MAKIPLAALAAALVPTLPVTAAPIITEFMASNDSSLYDEDGASSDWIEIHNPEAAAVDLTGFYLTDDAGELTKWPFPEVSLPAGRYLIVFASNKDRDVGELHANFRLPKDAGGYLALVDPDGQTVVSDYADYPEQFDDFSYGRAQTGGTTTEVLVREGDACKVLVPTSDIGTTWQALAFDDEAWSDGTTGVGYEAGSGYEDLIGPGGDVRAQTEDINSTAYVRIPFSVDSKDGMGQLTFRMKYDDGFIAYLNGVEIASGNKPANPTWDSDASEDHSDNLATSFVDTDLTAQIGSLLNVGNNLLAIHSMNGDTGSSDLLALPRIEAEFISDPGELGEAGYFQTSSPGNANGVDQGLPAGAVTISQPGRGFTGSLSVTLSTPSPAAQIRYTTNGNVPSGSSTLYNGGNININSSTLLRARAIEAGLTSGPVAEEGYIRLSSSAQSFSSDLPVVIMERFSGGPTAANGKAFTFFAFFEPDPGSGRTSLNKPYSLGTRGGFKTRGSSSSGFPKKAYSIEAWNEDNRNKDISPLGMPEESDWILNARSEFDRSLMRNAFIYELSNQVGRYAVRTQFVELFKDDNGGDLTYGTSSGADYDGVYTFMEKITRDKERVDVERLPQSITEEPGVAGGYMLKIDRADPGDSGFGAGGQSVRWVYPKEEDATGAQSAWIQNYINQMNASLSTPDYANYIDVDSWVDHHLLNVLALNADALRLSTYFFKTREGKMEFGPIWDFDRSMESTDGRDNNPSTWSGGTNYFTYPWWGTLFNDENFWQVYIDRYFELRDGPFATANVHAIIDGMAAELNEAQVRNFQRFSSDLPRFGSYQGEVNHLKDWLGTRLTWMDGQFAPRPTSNRNPGTYPAGTTVTLSANLAGGRQIFYTLDGTDPRPQSEGGPVNGTTLFDESQPAVAFVPSSDIGTTWRGGNEPFNDSTWIAGINGVGYERSSGYDPYINIDLDTEMANQTSCYVRIKFDVDAGELATWNFMSLGMRYDDGFVAYLNGTQIAASNNPGGLAWNSSATQTNDDGSAVSFQEFNANAFLGSLQAGENVLAIHALNESTGSSDFLNQARLIAGFDEDGGGGGTGGTLYTGPLTLDQTARLFARVFDPSGGNNPGSGTPVGTGWSAPLRVEYLIDEVPAAAGNFAITEIMHDPYDLGDALIGDSAFEWLELTNISAGPISLTDVRFTEGFAFGFPSQSLAPGASVIVVSDAAAFEQVYGADRAALVVGAYSGGLSKGGETLTVSDAIGAVIQSVVFPGDVAKGGRSLVADGAGWRASRSILGSPGTAEPTPAEVPDVFVNEVLTNSPAPQVDTVELWNPSGAPVDVSGWFLTDDLSQPEKFQLPGGSEISAGGYLTLDESDFATFAFGSFGEEVFLIAAQSDGSRLDYVDGFSFGDASAGVPFGRHVISTGDVHYAPMRSQSFGSANAVPVAGPLVITELMYNPTPGAMEYVEVQNVSGTPIALAGAELGGSGFVFGAATPPLFAGGIILFVEGDPAAFRAANGVPAAVEIYGPLPGALDNGGERLRVRVPESTGVVGEPALLVSLDIAKYDDDAPWPASADGVGDSLHRVSPAGYGGDPASWEAAAPTPGVVGDTPPFDWRTLFFTAEEIANPAISGPLADADGDRFSNLLEYLLGSDPRDGSSFRSPSASVVDGFIELSFTLRDGVTDYIAEIESSEELRAWVDASAGFTLTGTVSNGDGTSTLTYRGPLADGRLYLRLRAVEAP